MTNLFEPPRRAYLISRAVAIHNLPSSIYFVLEINQEVIDELKKMDAVARNAKNVSLNVDHVSFDFPIKNFFCFFYKGANEFADQLLEGQDYALCAHDLLSQEKIAALPKKSEVMRGDAFGDRFMCFHGFETASASISIAWVEAVINCPTRAEFVSKKDLQAADQDAVQWLQKRASVDSKAEVLVMPQEAWDLLEETLHKDSESSAFDRNLRSEISSALEQVVVYGGKE